MKKKKWTHKEYPGKIFTGSYSSVEGKRVLQLKSGKMKPITVNTVYHAYKQGWKYK